MVVMSIDHFLPFPNNIIDMYRALSSSLGIVIRVDDPTFSGRVMVKVTDIWGDTKSNWISVASGAGNGPGVSQTGMSAPLRPGQSVLVFHPGGNMDKSCCMVGPPWLSEPGDPGSKVA